MTEIPDDVEWTLIEALENLQMQLDADPSLANMGGPTEEELDEALDWVRGEQ